MTPTDEQVAIMDAARTTGQNLMIKSYAGTGKTTTIEMMAKVLPVRPTLYLVFNVRNKKEAEARMPPHIHCKTVNGLGNEAWNRTTGKRCIVDADKMSKLLKDTIKHNVEYRDMGKDEWSSVLSLIRRARVEGLIPEPFCQQYPGLIPDTDDGWKSVGDTIYLDVHEGYIFLAREVLLKSIQMAYDGTVDYDDQIYMSALFGGVFTKYAEVMVDEGQDLSPLMHLMVSQAAVGRLSVVGDPLQAIYAFRGADSASMEKLRDLRPMDQWTDLALTLTYRCPKLTVERQQKHAKGFRAADTNPDGEHFFYNVANPNTLENEPWGIERVERMTRNGEITILCRNNAPLIAAALRIIKGGRGCTVLGKDIGKSLVTLSKKLFPDDNTPIVKCAEKINEWEKRETGLAQANQKEAHLAVIQDKAECIRAVLGSPLCRDGATLRDLLTRMFDAGNMRITLATGHKAKGGEWPCLVYLDPWRIPSKYAAAKAATGDMVAWEQELNLKYVIETRSKNITVFANLEEMQ